MFSQIIVVLASVLASVFADPAYLALPTPLPYSVPRDLFSVIRSYIQDSALYSEPKSYNAVSCTNLAPKSYLWTPNPSPIPYIITKSYDSQSTNTPVPCNFQYNINIKNDVRSYVETSDGNGYVNRFYSLLESDDTKRIVEYTADEGGFNTVVKKEENGPTFPTSNQCMSRDYPDPSSYPAYPTFTNSQNNPDAPTYPVVPAYPAAPAYSASSTYSSDSTYPAFLTYPPTKSYPQSLTYPPGPAYPVIQGYTLSSAYPSSPAYSTAPGYPSAQVYQSDRAFPSSSRDQPAPAYPPTLAFPAYAQSYPNAPNYPDYQSYLDIPNYPEDQSYPDNPTTPVYSSSSAYKAAYPANPAARTYSYSPTI